MAGLPPLQKISQQHTNIYENYFRQVNPAGIGKIAAVEAAKFLKKSNLPEGTLHKIWELADQGSKGYLDKQGFYIALKLISLAQNGLDCSINNLALSTAPPNMGNSPTGMSLAFPSAKMGSDSSSITSTPLPSTSTPSLRGITPQEKQQYDGIFDSLKPISGLLSGDKVKPVLLNSKLPVDKLGKIWELSDIDGDGSLDRDEFVVAMHLVYRAIEGAAVPVTLPANLIPLSKRKLGATIVPPAVLPTNDTQGFSSIPFAAAPTAKTSQWVVQPSDKLKFDQMFTKADTDNDGLVSGGEIKDILIASGLSQNYLAHIWNLCDINNTGQLNADQFALAMYLINLKRSGKELPQVLTPEMMPPSSSNDLSSITIESTSNDFSAIKELDVITTSIESLGREKVKLQQEITETEEAIRSRRSEIEKLNNELDKANKGLEMLNKQKQESQTNLQTLDGEYDKSFEMLKDIKAKCAEEKQYLEQLRTQLASQESTNKEQEQDMAKSRRDLDELKKEESELESQIKKNKAHLESMKSKQAAAKVEMTQVQGRIDKLTDDNNALKEEITQYQSNSALSSLNDNFDTRFKDVDQISARATAGSSPVSSISGFSVGSAGKVDDDDFKDSDPFKSKIDPFSGNESETTDPFNSDDPFKSDPFKSVSFADDPFTGDPFATTGGDDPFKSDPFQSSNNLTDAGKDPVASGSDPFVSLDPFGSGAFSGTGGDGAPFQTPVSKPTTADPFASSNDGESSRTPVTKVDPFLASDPFGSNDPFASSSSSNKANVDGNSQNDPFSSSTNPGDPFASSSSTADDPFMSSSSTSKPADPFKSSTSTGVSDDPFSSTADTSNDPFLSSTTTSDPFTSGSASSKNDPFASTPGGDGADPFASSASTTTTGGDNWFAFSDGASGGVSTAKSDIDKKKESYGINEDSQIEWAKRESKREESERRRRIKELAEKEEMEIAIALKQSVESSSEA